MYIFVFLLTRTPAAPGHIPDRRQSPETPLDTILQTGRWRDLMIEDERLQPELKFR